MVSVIIPAYNAAKYIPETLDSVLSQTTPAHEIIVINDGSPDTAALEAVLERFQGRIQYVKQENRGPGSARNTGIRRASGEFLAFLDSDDLWLPKFLAEQLRFLEENSATDMVCADCAYFGEGALSGKTWQALHPIQPPVTLSKLLPTHGGAFASFAVLRKEIVRRTGFFDETLRVCEDYNYWLRLVHCGGILVYSPKVLGRRRLHSESLTHDPSTVLPHAINALEKLSATLDAVSPEAALVRNEMNRSNAQLHIQEGRRKLELRDYHGARESLKAAYEALPSRKLKATLWGLGLAPAWTRSFVSTWEKGLQVRAKRR